MIDEELMETIKALPREKTMLLPALRIVQNHFGFLPPVAMEEVGKWLHVPKSEVYGAATSYADLEVHPRAKHEVKVCTGASCRMNGSERLMRKAEQVLGIKYQERTSGDNFELDKVDCAFVCGVAPVVKIDGVTYGQMSEDSVAEAIDAIRKDSDTESD